MITVFQLSDIVSKLYSKYGQDGMQVFIDQVSAKAPPDDYFILIFKHVSEANPKGWLTIELFDKTHHDMPDFHPECCILALEAIAPLGKGQSIEDYMKQSFLPSAIKYEEYPYWV